MTLHFLVWGLPRLWQPNRNSSNHRPVDQAFKGQAMTASMRVGAVAAVALDRDGVVAG